MFLLCQSSAGSGSGKGTGKAEEQQKRQRNRVGNGNAIQGGVCLKDIKEKVRIRTRRSAILPPGFPKNWCVLPCWKRKRNPGWRQTRWEEKRRGISGGIRRKPDRTGRTAGWKGKPSAAYRGGGKKLAVKTYEKIKSRGKENPLQPRWTAKQEAVEHLDRQGQRKGAQEPEGASRSNLKQRKQSRRPETGQ